jgi:ABC-type lipoprotein export system ATPase subunit
MEITFSNIIPAPIPDNDIKKSEIWSRDFKLSSPEEILIYADSGKGKTTFINIIFGLRKDYTGDLLIDNKNIRNFSIAEISNLRKAKLSIVPQGLLLFPELTVIENIIIKNKIQNFQSSEKIAQMLETLGLNGFQNRKAANLSFGQKQRVAIIRALCQSFEFILLDEAFSHLDYTNKFTAWNLIQEEAKRQNAGIILTSLSSEFDSKTNKMKI